MAVDYQTLAFVQRLDPWELPSVGVRDWSLLPHCSGVYFVMEERVMFIGKSVDIRQRWRVPIFRHQFSETARIAWRDTIRDPWNAEELAVACIAHWQPPLNRGNR